MYWTKDIRYRAASREEKRQTDFVIQYTSVQGTHRENSQI